MIHTETTSMLSRNFSEVCSTKKSKSFVITVFGNTSSVLFILFFSRNKKALRDILSEKRKKTVVSSSNRLRS